MIKHIIFLVFFFLTNQGFGGSAHSCRKSQNNFSDLSDVNKKFDDSWWSVESEDILNSPCKNTRPPSTQEMLDFLNSYNTGVKTSSKVNGINFKDEDPFLIKLFQDLNEPNIVHSELRPNFSSSCQKVICAVQQIYGAKEGLQLLYMLKKYGFNGSNKIVDNASAWRADELDDVLTMFSDYPSSFFPISYNKQFTHFQRGQKLVGGEKTIANAVVEVFDNWNNLPPEKKQSALLHEVGHNLGSIENKDLSPAWLNISKWKSKTEIVANATTTSWIMGDPSASVSKYGEGNPAEDFAETVVAYRYNGQRLKNQNPNKYNFMKNKVFDGIEYDSPANCVKGTLAQQKSKKTQAIAAELMSKKTISTKVLGDDKQLMDQIENTCTKAVLLGLGKKLPSTELCVRENIEIIYLKKAAREKGIEDFNPKTEDLSRQQTFKFSDAQYAEVTKKIKKNLAKKIETTLAQGSNIFKDSSIPKDAACKSGNKYIYQAFEKDSAYSFFANDNIFTFFDQKEYLAEWANQVCSAAKGSTLKSKKLIQTIESKIP